MASKAEIAYKRIILESRRRLAQAAGGGNLAEIKRIYTKAQEELIRKLKAVPVSSEFTRHQFEMMLAQIRGGQAAMATAMVKGMDRISLSTQEAALGGVKEDVARMAKFSGNMPVLRVQEALNFNNVINPIRPSLLALHERSVARYGTTMIKRMQDRLSLGMIDGSSQDELVAKISEEAGVGWSGAERIVRTEQSFALNATATSGYEEIASTDPQGGMWIRWVEHVTDSGIPMDNRVGDDSIIMHGQITMPGGLFTMPDDPDAPRSLVGKSWMHGPCRPNGREICTAWRQEWGGYAYRVMGGRIEVVSEG